MSRRRALSGRSNGGGSIIVLAVGSYEHHGCARCATVPRQSRSHRLPSCWRDFVREHVHPRTCSSTEQLAASVTCRALKGREQLTVVKTPSTVPRFPFGVQ